MTWRTLAVGFPFTFIRKPPQTLLDAKRAAWTGPIAYRVTQPVETRKQWKRLQITKRRA